MQKKIALFPGSFDPITKAHLDVIQRATPLFDEIYIGLGLNSSKTPMFSQEQRLNMLRELFEANPSIKVTTYSGLTVDFCREIGAQYILRGMRNGNDFDFENAIAQNNLQLAPEIQSVFLLSSPGYGHISSTIVRDILKHRGDVQHLVPSVVLKYC